MKSDRNRPNDILEAGNDAGVIMTHYKQMVGREAKVGDLITDLITYCQQNHIEFDEEFEYAKATYAMMVQDAFGTKPKRGEIA